MKKTYLVDVKNKILGRMATEIANVLSGRGKVNFTPHIDDGDIVVVINSDLVAVSGDKKKGKIYNRYSGYPGGITAMTFEDQVAKDSRVVIKAAVYGMLPKNKLRNKMMKRLKIYQTAEHPHTIDSENK